MENKFLFEPRTFHNNIHFKVIKQNYYSCFGLIQQISLFSFLFVLFQNTIRLHLGARKNYQQEV